MRSGRISTMMLGQSGCRLKVSSSIIYIDPYLSNSVQTLDSQDLERLIPAPFQPDEVTDADIVIISHEHIDHCDPHTVPALAKTSPQAYFYGPATVLEKIKGWGVSEERLIHLTNKWLSLAPDVKIRAIPAAHPDIQFDNDGNCVAIGFLIEYAEKKIYFAGDTSANQEIIDILNAEGSIHTAFLPVNEHNFFKGRRGIVGNMSIREAFLFAEEIGARQVVAMHWDMFAVNSAEPEEIKLIHKLTNSNFTLLINPTHINLSEISISVVLRTLNEEKYLGELLESINDQSTNGLGCEVVLIDSGSTDNTLDIAKKHGCRILHIKREEFSFGRSLNIGCEAALGDILVITSGHCVPKDKFWLQKICQPLIDGSVEYAYGRQLAGPTSKFSEERIFAKYFPAQTKVPQEGFFCNNANSALLKSTWEKYKFDEELTGLEDMELAQRLVSDGGKVGYIADAEVFHHHAETWCQIRRRFERESLALQKIMPQVHVSYFDTLRYIVTSIQKDWRYARTARVKVSFTDICRYRWNQYIGAWKGNKSHKRMSRLDKEKYYYPD